MKIFDGKKWVNVAGDAGFVDGILIVGGDNDRQIIVKDGDGEVLGVLSKNGIELNSAKFKSLEAENVVPCQKAITYYVNANTGDDNNNGLSSSTAFKSINTAVDLLKNKKLIESCKIEIAQGTYDESLWIEGLSGAGLLTLNFASNVVVNGLINVTGCSNMVVLNGTKTTLNQTEDIYNYAITANFSTHLRVIGFNINAQPRTQHGVLAYRGATISIKDSSINNLTNTSAAAITAYENSMIYVDNCTGSNNYRSLWSASGSVVSINNKIPLGDNSNQQSTGQIYGTATPTSFEGTIPNPPTVVSKTLTLTATSYSFWRTTLNKWQSGIYIGDFSLSTGGSGTGGNNLSVFGIDMASIRTKLKGKKVTSVKIGLSRKTSGGYDSKVTPYLGLTTSAGSGSAPTVFKEIGSLGTFSKGQERKVSLPVSVINDIINNTSVKSFILYRPDKKQYSIFENSMKIYITYEEEASTLSDDIPQTLEEPIV